LHSPRSDLSLKLSLTSTARSPNNQRQPTVPAFDSSGNSAACFAISRQVSNST
jgi:hypothetical protein